MPFFIIRDKKKLIELYSKDILLVIASDPSFELDMNVFIKKTNSRLLKLYNIGMKRYFFIERVIEDWSIPVYKSVVKWFKCLICG